jgi:hypothetical protein
MVFDEKADISIMDVRPQNQEGRLMTIKGSNGLELRPTSEPDPRLIGKAGKILKQFAEFAGLTDRTKRSTPAVRR